MYLDLSFLFVSLFCAKAFDIKISLWEYFFFTSLHIYCPSFFHYFRMCHLFLFDFLSSLLFIAVFSFFGAYFY